MMTNKKNSDEISQLLEQIKAAQDMITNAQVQLSSLGYQSSIQPDSDQESATGKVIHGVFDGQNMLGDNQKLYTVPANYASKSKLVEGDTLKLTIEANGNFIYKQIGPIDRVKAVGKLVLDDNQYYVETEDNRYRVLYASVSYFKAVAGDELSIILPKDSTNKPRWAAVEAVIA